MKMTRRGERVFVAAVVLTCFVLLLGAAWVGQAWKADRLSQPQDQTVSQGNTEGSKP